MSAPRTASFAFRSWRFWAINIAVWSVLGFLGTAQAFARASADGGRWTLSHSLTLTMPFYWLWALATPAIGAGVDRLERMSWRLALAAHAALAVLVTLLHAFAYVLVARTIGAVLHMHPSTDTLSLFLRRYGAADVLVYGAIAGAYLVSARYRAFRAEEQRAAALALRAARLETELATARLDALRLQLQPHFLFNALHSVSTLVLKRDADGAIRMLSLVGDFLRGALTAVTARDYSLEEEIEMVERYMDIERVRFGSALRVEWNVDAAALPCRVPRLILQPLVENAVRHGIGSGSRSGTIVLTARRSGDALRIVVADDGPGGAPRPATSVGIGLANTRDRVQHYYGPESRVDVTSADASGWAVTIDVPHCPCGPLDTAGGSA